MEKTTCYKCDTEITAEAGVVHPLCDTCDSAFDAWFEKELAMFKK